MDKPQDSIDSANQSFWDELCGSELARSLGIADASPEELDRFDAAYMAFYPYLWPYLATADGARVLEIGTGLRDGRPHSARPRDDYTGLDIAPGPVSMTELSLRRFGQPETQAVQGSALALPFEPASFDQVIAIGSLHHTGDLRKALDEVHRVLKDGGRASVMVYNAHSLNRLVTTPTARTLARSGRRSAG